MMRQRPEATAGSAGILLGGRHAVPPKPDNQEIGVPKQTTAASKMPDAPLIYLWRNA